MVDTRILSWNLFLVPYLAEQRTERTRRIAGRIHELTPLPDIVCLQEVFFPKHARILKEILAPRYTPCDLAKHKAYPPWFLPGANIGGLFYDIRRSGLLTLVSDTWEIERAKMQYFSHEASELKVWQGDGYADKGFLWTILVHRSTGTRICTVNTHLQAYAEHQHVRLKQLGEIWKRMKSIACIMPVFIAGDMNAKDGSEELELVTKRFGWRVLSSASGSACDASVLTPLRGERGVDHVFVVGRGSEHISAVSASICNIKKAKPFSDHDAVVVDATLPNGTASGELIRRLWTEVISRRRLPMQLFRLWNAVRGI